MRRLGDLLERIDWGLWGSLASIVSLVLVLVFERRRLAVAVKVIGQSKRLRSSLSCLGLFAGLIYYLVVMFLVLTYVDQRGGFNDHGGARALPFITLAVAMAPLFVGFWTFHLARWLLAGIKAQRQRGSVFFELLGCIALLFLLYVSAAAAEIIAETISGRLLLD
jgi:hypothetical protein